MGPKPRPLTEKTFTAKGGEDDGCTNAGCGWALNVKRHFGGKGGDDGCVIFLCEVMESAPKEEGKFCSCRDEPLRRTLNRLVLDIVKNQISQEKRKQKTEQNSTENKTQKKIAASSGHFKSNINLTAASRLINLVPRIV